MLVQVLPTGAGRGDDLTGLRLPIAHQRLARGVRKVRIVDLAERQLAGEERIQLIEELQLVLERELDVDALDRIRVIAHAIERNHDVLVDLEGVRMPRDRRRTRAIQPELLSCIGADRDEALARTTVRDAHDFGRGARDCVVVLADDVAEQHHLRQVAALRFRRVADRAQVTFVQMLETGELHTGRARLVLEISLDLDDRRDRMPRMTEEFEAHRSNVLRHLVQ